MVEVGYTPHAVMVAMVIIISHALWALCMINHTPQCITCTSILWQSVDRVDNAFTVHLMQKIFG